MKITMTDGVTKVTLDDGTGVEGTPEQVSKVLKAMGVSGDGIFYVSATHGITLIKGMNSIHLRNAILKQYLGWVKDLHLIDDPKKVVEAILIGIEDPTWQAMVKELATREE